MTRGLPAALLALCASSGAASAATPAKLAYVTGLAGTHPQVHVANADGSGAIGIGGGVDALLSPDGANVAIVTVYNRQGTSLVVRPAGGGAARTLVRTGDSIGPMTWSPDGTRLAVVLNTTRLVAIDVASGHARDLTGRFDGVIGAGLSPDGRTVLVQRGYFDDPRHQSVATVPFGGGRATVLVRHGSEPSWDG